MIKIRYGQYPLLFLNSLIFCYSLGVFGAEKYILPQKCLFYYLLLIFSLPLFLY